MEKRNGFFELLPRTEADMFYVWGTGNTAQLYTEGFRREKGISIKGYIDNNPEKWGKTFDGKRILRPDEYRERMDAPVLVCTVQKSVFDSVTNQIENMGGIPLTRMRWFFRGTGKRSGKYMICFRMSSQSVYTGMYSAIV